MESVITDKAAEVRDMASTTDNKKLARRFIHNVVNERNFVAAEKLVSDRAYDMAQEALNRFAIYSAFPDYRVNIERIIAEDHRVAVIATYAGTHQGEFLGIPPTGKVVIGREIDIFTIEDGKIASIEYNLDLIEIANQLQTFPEEAFFMPADGR